MSRPLSRNSFAMDGNAAHGRAVVVKVTAMTCASMALSAVVTWSLVQIWLGYWAPACVSGSDVLRIAMKLSTGIPALVCPLLGWRRVQLKEQLHAAHAELQRLASTDQLTGLLNRRGFDIAAAQILANAALAGQPVATMMCDIDHFKRVNDEYGHDFGDEAIVHMANILREIAGAQGAIVGRQGGEEFVLLLPGFEPSGALALAERCRTACATRPVEFQSRSARITVSIGVAGLGRFDASLAQLVKLADTALYQAKSAGRDRVMLWVESGFLAAAE